jgi:hypothetical protein
MLAYDADRLRWVEAEDQVEAYVVEDIRFRHEHVIYHAVDLPTANASS